MCGRSHLHPGLWLCLHFSKQLALALYMTNIKSMNSRIIFLLNIILFPRKNFNIWNFSIEQRSLCIPLTLYTSNCCIIHFYTFTFSSYQLYPILQVFKRGLANVKLKTQNSDVISQSKSMSAPDCEHNKLISPPELLESIFHKVDEDNDELLSIDEVAKYIHFKTQEHIENAMQKNYGLFMIIDTSLRNDRNDDDILTEDEFAQLKVGEAGEALLSQGEKERREEFRNLVDANGDGEADKKDIVMNRGFEN